MLDRKPNHEMLGDGGIEVSLRLEEVSRILRRVSGILNEVSRILRRASWRERRPELRQRWVSETLQIIKEGGRSRWKRRHADYYTWCHRE